MIFECQMCHAQTAAACSCIKNQWGVPYAPSAPIMPPLTEQRVREIVREEIARSETERGDRIFPGVHK